MNGQRQNTLSLFLCIIVAFSTKDAYSADLRYGVTSDLVWMESNHLVQTLGALVELQPGIFRLPLRWGVVEPTQGQWNFSRVDSVVSQVPQTTEIMGILLHTPTWANGVDPSEITGWPEAYMPTNLTAWSNYVFKVVDRYGARIKYWEVLNEPNGRDYFRPEPDPVLFTTLLKLAYGAINRANTNCFAVLGGLQGNGVDPFVFEPVPVTNFLENVYLAGGKDYFDICATHPYVPWQQGQRKPHCGIWSPVFSAT